MRETPENQKLEEELVEVKLRDAESQLAIKELQKTIHVLNLEFQVIFRIFNSRRSKYWPPWLT